MTKNKSSKVAVSNANPRKISKNKTLNLILTIVALIIWVGGVYFLVQYILAFIIRSILQPTTNTPFYQTLYSILCYLISAAIILFVPKLINKKWKVSLEDLGIIELPTWTDIGLAPVGFLLYTLFANVLISLFSIFPWFSATEKQNVGYNSAMFGSDRLFALTALVVVAPIVEEIIFRGFLYGKLRKKLVKDIPEAKSKQKTKEIKAIKRKNRLGITIAIIITSLVFALMHRQWNVGINVFALSIILCLFREMTGTIYAGIIVHMLKNAIAFYLLYIVGMG